MQAQRPPQSIAGVFVSEGASSSDPDSHQKQAFNYMTNVKKNTVFPAEFRRFCGNNGGK
jgi:hypothetical protein